MTVAAAAGTGGALRWDGVEAEYVDPERGRERAPLAVCWPLRFERMSPVRGFRLVSGPAELAGLVVVLPHGHACGLRVVGGTRRADGPGR